MPGYLGTDLTRVLRVLPLIIRRSTDYEGLGWGQLYASAFYSNRVFGTCFEVHWVHAHTLGSMLMPKAPVVRVSPRKGYTYMPPGITPQHVQCTLTYMAFVVALGLLSSD